MKIILTFILVLGFSAAWAQKLELRIPSPSKPLKIKQIYPPLYPPVSYRFSQDSSMAYANIDNMPILLAQSPENMPNADIKMLQDSGSVYRMPNPLGRGDRKFPKKP
ncbi:hypothetical protein DR864_14710 [Runella rosea]|uniref:Uncharacterized protein n=1 Tax=Runella rosea TaxID=2259595 RepID=A0A344TJU1_9BACT|nr:hypothetical protein [Runella rosea]AXE18912.1 hypothetical protein DR864_14710 [Runella rosea]